MNLKYIISEITFWEMLSQQNPESGSNKATWEYWKLKKEEYLGANPDSNSSLPSEMPMETQSSSKEETSIRWLNRKDTQSIGPMVPKKKSSPYIIVIEKPVTIDYSW